MPPRLLGDTSIYGACHEQQVEDCHGFGVVDTLADFGGLWSFDKGAVAKVSNQYAAMPSMHTGWSTWCALVLIPMLRRRWAKVLVALYPVATVFCIMITGNHYWLDAVGGLVALGGGWLIGSNLAAFNERRLQRKVAKRADPRRSCVDPGRPGDHFLRRIAQVRPEPADRGAVVAADGDEALAAAGPEGEADLGAVAARLHADPRQRGVGRGPPARGGDRVEQRAAARPR